MEFLVCSILFCLAVFGATNLLTVGAIFKPLRDFLQLKKDKTPRKLHWPGKLISCPMCISFWIAILFSLSIWSPANNMLWKADWFNAYSAMLFDGCVGSITSWILYLLIAKRQFNM